MFPPSQAVCPEASRIEWIMAVVVDLPLLPVTAIVRAGHSSQNRPISVVTRAPFASANCNH